MAVGKEYKLCRVKTIRVTVFMIKDFDQHISVSLSDSLRRINMKLRAVILAESIPMGGLTSLLLCTEYFLGMI